MLHLHSCHASSSNTRMLALNVIHRYSRWSNLKCMTGNFCCLSRYHMKLFSLLAASRAPESSSQTSFMATSLQTAQSKQLQAADISCHISQVSVLPQSDVEDALRLVSLCRFLGRVQPVLGQVAGHQVCIQAC